VIRAARVDDVPIILAMVHELAEYEREPDAVAMTEVDLEQALFGPSPQVFALVAEEDGEVVGHAIWYLNFSTWSGRHGIWLDDLYVRPAARGQGYGVALVKALAAICVERGYGRLEWAVLDWNEPAIRIYQALGARSMDEWTINRVESEVLARLATS
jgi:GNAT superfamily N-acetyltransferase